MTSYTFYTILYFGVVTGCRPILNPYLPLSAISPLNRFAVLKDKAAEKARPVWIFNGPYQQIGYYDRYLQGTRLRYLDHNPCWFVAGDGTPYEVRPGTVEPILHRYLPGHRTNGHRRWTMNALWDSGAPPEIVRAWAGHARAGDAFWSMCATASYAQIGSELQKYLTPILDYLGLKPTPGARP